MKYELNSIIESSWNDFKKWYDERCESHIKNVVRNKIMSHEKAVHEPWVCWSEKDIVTHLSRMVFERTIDLDIHVEFSLKPENFKNFHRLCELLWGVRKKVGRKRITPDMVVCYDTHDEPLLTVIEAKMYRGQYGRNDFQKGIDKDLETLKGINEVGACHNVYWMVLDDHYWLKKEEISRQMEKDIETFRKNGIRVMYHKSTIKKKFLG
jgi:hypothetical protein